MSQNSVGTASSVRAWIAVALIPVAALVALVIGYVMTGALESEDAASPQLWADALTLLVMVVIVAVPTMLALRAAGRAGQSGRAPRLVAVLLGGALLVWFVGGLLWNLLSGMYS
jgi:hypothetical protein